MKSLFKLAAICSYLTATISAAPSGLISIAIQNEFSGKSATVVLPADGRLRRLNDLFANTALNNNGQFFGTSARLVHPVADTTCTIRTNLRNFILNSSKPAVELDGNQNVALLKPVVLNGFQIQCQM
ncbi:hypothetical protein CC86DRAFT_435291 [Ophiobolus disseminans]|uniref:Uncharacterized protein n=1 Tax=Ophiobolus disseminans TaxID=1469910 RepID=A0A6A6ZCU7_9PLEO|nr:hypothetical protein CC86DRAFT_435291 [Ophiobolus disseminans]